MVATQPERCSHDEHHDSRPHRDFPAMIDGVDGVDGG
jgi:hypothetical protein